MAVVVSGSSDHTWGNEITLVPPQRSCSLCYTHAQIAGVLFRPVELIWNVARDLLQR